MIHTMLLYLWMAAEGRMAGQPEVSLRTPSKQVRETAANILENLKERGMER